MAWSYFISDFIEGGNTFCFLENFFILHYETITIFFQKSGCRSAICKDLQHFSHRSELLNTLLMFEEPDRECSVKHSRSSDLAALLLVHYLLYLASYNLINLIRDLDGRRMGITTNSSVLTYLSFVIKNLKKSRSANLLANRKPHLFFILSQSKAAI